MLVSITEAAKRLTALGDKVDRSTLSRYLKQHAEALPLQVDGKSNLVEWEALLIHRGENIRVPAIPFSPLPPPSPISPPSTVSRFAGSQADGAARKVQAEAELRELDLAERRGELTPRDEVDRAGRDAVALMTSAFERAVETTAAQASVKYGWDERQARLILKAHTREGLGIFHRELLERIERLGTQGDGDGGSGVEH